MDQYDLGDANVRRGYALGGSPYTDPRRLQAAIEQSPLAYATKVKAPTLLMSNTGDYHALRDNGVILGPTTVGDQSRPAFILQAQYLRQFLTISR